MTNSYTGSCLCGAISFSVRGPLAPVQVCHCLQCRKAQGGPFATNIPVERAAVTFLSGEAQLRQFESSPGKIRAFCPACGSPVFSARTAQPDVIRLRAGLIEQPLPQGLAFHQFAASACNWWPWQDDLPRYAERGGESARLR